MKIFRSVLEELNSDSVEEYNESFGDKTSEIDFKNSRVNSRAQ